MATLKSVFASLSQPLQCRRADGLSQVTEGAVGKVHYWRIAGDRLVRTSPQQVDMSRLTANYKPDVRNWR